MKLLCIRRINVLRVNSHCIGMLLLCSISSFLIHIYHKYVYFIYLYFFNIIKHICINSNIMICVFCPSFTDPFFFFTPSRPSMPIFFRGLKATSPLKLCEVIALDIPIILEHKNKLIFVLNPFCAGLFLRGFLNMLAVIGPYNDYEDTEHEIKIL